MTQNLFDFDRNFNLSAIAGVDEVGRGPLAGREAPARDISTTP